VHVQQALDRAALVPDDSDVTAETKDGIITLTGHVRTWAEHNAVVGAVLMARGSSPADLYPWRGELGKDAGGRALERSAYQVPGVDRG
jgi:BON domain